MMKLQILSSIFFAAALAFPLEADTDVQKSELTLRDIRDIGATTVHTSDESAQALPALEKRLDLRTCKRVGKQILKIGTSTATLAYVNIGSHFVQNVCKKEGYSRCDRYTGYIRDGYTLIFALSGRREGAAAESSNADNFSSHSARDVTAENNDFNNIEDALKSHGYSFDLLEIVDLSGLNLTKRDSEPIMTSRSIVRNLRSGNSSAPTDMALNTFDNGVATLDIAGDLQKLATYGDSEERVEKRFDGAGFKIVFSTRMHSKLTVSHQKQMSLAIAKEWARRGDSTSMNEFFGLVKTGHKANFYHRIIPEVRGFGMNYESVDACGQMASFL